MLTPDQHDALSMLEIISHLIVEREEARDQRDEARDDVVEYDKLAAALREHLHDAKRDNEALRVQLEDQARLVLSLQGRLDEAEDDYRTAVEGYDLRLAEYERHGDGLRELVDQQHQAWLSLARSVADELEASAANMASGDTGTPLDKRRASSLRGQAMRLRNPGASENLRRRLAAVESDGQGASTKGGEG